jgi:transcriptional regulator with PAS, ATPase and Fis domain
MNMSFEPPVPDTSGQLSETILDNIPIGILYCDKMNIIRLINNTYAGYLQVEKHDAIGRAITDFLPSSRAAIVIQSGVAEMTSTCCIKRNDGDIKLIVNRLPVRDHDQQIIGFISQSIIADTDELKGLSEKIRQLDRKVSFYQRRMQSALSAFYSLKNIIGGSEAIATVKDQLTHYARTLSPVLILGETGTGKELFASAVHLESRRAEQPFVCINCAAIPQELFESELFGYLPGAFSGARKEGKVGQIELADTGTLFLDEIGDMPLQIQAKLLRVLEDKAIHRLGATRPNTVDFRLVAATNRNLKEAIRENTFREDLYYRISSLTLTIPPLRDRLEDVPVLVEHFLEKLDRRGVSFSERTLAAMRGYCWPGNIRELRNAVIRAVSLCKGNVVEPGELPPEVLANGPYCVVRDSDQDQRVPAPEAKPLARRRGDTERGVILAALEKNGWNMVRTAKELGISRATLYHKTGKYGIKRRQQDQAASTPDPDRESSWPVHHG